MTSHSDSAPAQPAGRTPTGTNGPHGKLIEYEQFIEAQLRKTRGHVRGVDIAASLMTLAAGTLAFFFLAAMIDHWVIQGGLGFWERLSLFAGYVVVAAYYLATRLLPLFLRRINPVYAAHMIERSRPSLKNALVNFLMFRANREGLPRVVYQAIEEQAATNLAKVHVETAVDRSKLIRIGYALVGILLVCALYTLLSPKDLLKTVGRVAMPWAEISAPTRTAIVEIEPGNASAFRGQQVTVSARIQGLPSDGKVTLFYTTSDGQIVERPLEMNLPIDGYQHTCVLPAADAVLQQSLEYRITAGDATSQRFQIEVVAAPTIVVRGVEYKYPTYTGLLAQRVEHQGDIKAIEGTEVTLVALANQDIESASIDFDCDGKPDALMQVDKLEAKATFRLRLKDDHKTPEHTCYQLLFENEKGQQNPQPVRHQIEVMRDLPPEIQFVSPKKDEIDLPLNAAVNLEIVANDPDFSLRLVKLSASVGKQPLLDKMLLNEQRRGQFVNKFRFEPRKAGLKAGDVVEYLAVAEDNKDPRPNRTETATRRIRIVSPSQQPPSQDRLAKNDQESAEQQPGGDGNPGGDRERPRDNADKTDLKSEKTDPQGKPRDGNGAEEGGEEQPKENPTDQQRGQDDGQGEKSAGETTQQRSGETGDRSGQQREVDPRVPNDGSDDGDAVERILKHRDEQDKSSPKPRDGQQRPGEQQNSAVQKSGDQKKPGSQRPGDGQQNDSQAVRQEQNPANGDQNKGGSPPGENPRDRNSAEHNNADQPDRQQKPNPEQPGDEKQSGQQGDDRQGGSKPQSSRPPNPQKSDRSQGDQGEKGAGGKGQGEDSPSGQQGQKGQQGKGPNGKGQDGQSGESQDAAGQDSTERGGKGGKAKPTDPKPGDEKLPAEQGDGPAKGKGTKREKTDADHQSPQAGDQADGQSGERQGSGIKPDSKNPPQTQLGDEQNGEGEPAGKSDEKHAGKKSDRADNGQVKQEDRTTDESENGTPDKSDALGDAKQGQGGQSKGDPNQDANKKSSRDKQNPDAKGGDGENEKGESGAGQAGQETKGSPTPMQQNQSVNKSQKPAGDEKNGKPDDAPQSPSISKKESDSQGIDDGDRSGGGKKGGGQKANKSGTGGAGQSTAADEGAGRSDESGKGETSGRAGGDRKADKPTGQSGSQAGQGSASKPSSKDGDKPGEGKALRADSPQTQPGVPTDSSSQHPGQPGGAPNSGQPNGGKPLDRPPPEQAFAPSANEAEAANLDYARKSTDLALAHLKDQLRKDQPDPELLNRLGWTRKDLENFVRRWEQMRKAAQVPGEKGTASRQELDGALRSLGLRPRGSSLAGNTRSDDQSRGYKESRRTSPPPEYAPQYKAFQQGTSRGGK